jgi:predicted CXXCH cytochrome family protein
MQRATADTVVGDFHDTSFKYAGVDYEFSKRDGKFFTFADDSVGDIREFEISHTFGIEPLQQYLVTFPDGRRQALGVAWDTRPADEGGQRWFHLYPDETVDHEDELHWTGRNQNWNYMCADCHSTDVRKNYELTSKNYATSWAEISVGCEACHGPGSAHVAAANNEDYAATGLTTLLTSQENELDTCARCHSRRSVLMEGFTPGGQFLDHYRPELLSEGLYHADGQIIGEVYVYGSFLQSKMYQRGVRCTDCHNPHTARLEAPGNATCTRCHQDKPPAEFETLHSHIYDAPEHHFHEPGSEGAQCVSCHMPSKLYMVVDPRRDHSFRVPRPDLTESIGVPNACNACHEDKTTAWAAAEIEQQFANGLPVHYGEVLAAGRTRNPDAPEKVAALAADISVPAIVRGTALSLLDGYADAVSVNALANGLKDPAPLVRFGALGGTRRMNAELRWQLAQHLLEDPLLVLRIEAAALLAPLLESDLLQADRARLINAIRDYTSTQLLNADRPEALTNLGDIYATVGNDVDAERAYRDALDLDPGWVPALVNLADFYRGRGRNGEGAPLLKQAVTESPQNGDVRFAYGLLLVRQGRSAEALAELEQAMQLSPNNAHYRYVYGVALNSEASSAEAITVLRNGHEKFPEDIDILFALATIERDRGDTAQALIYARRLLRLRPADPNLQKLNAQLESAASD